MERNQQFDESAGVCDQRKKNTLVKSCEESSKREPEVMIAANELLGVEKLDVETRKFLHQGLRHLRRTRDEEIAAEEILVEVKQRRQQTEDDMWTEREEYIASGDSERRRSGCMNAKVWQMVQSSSTKAENLENDCDELAATIRDGLG